MRNSTTERIPTRATSPAHPRVTASRARSRKEGRGGGAAVLALGAAGGSPSWLTGTG